MAAGEDVGDGPVLGLGPAGGLGSSTFTWFSMTIQSDSDPRAASVAWLSVQPAQDLYSQPRVSGIRGSSWTAWLPQKFIARNTGTRPFASLGVTTMRSITVGSLAPQVTRTRRSTPRPPKKSGCSPTTSNRSLEGRAGRSPYM